MAVSLLCPDAAAQYFVVFFYYEKVLETKTFILWIEWRTYSTNILE